MKALLATFAMLTISLSTQAGGSYKIEQLCKDVSAAKAVKTTRSGLWDLLNTVPERIQVYKIKSNGKLRRQAKERLFSTDGSANVSYNMTINAQEYVMMLESDTFEYYQGLRTDKGDIHDKALLYNKVTKEMTPMTCD